jgi:hypothetical protein
MDPISHSLVSVSNERQTSFRCCQNSTKNTLTPNREEKRPLTQLWNGSRNQILPCCIQVSVKSPPQEGTTPLESPIMSLRAFNRFAFGTRSCTFGTLAFGARVPRWGCSAIVRMAAGAGCWASDEIILRIGVSVLQKMN